CEGPVSTGPFAPISHPSPQTRPSAARRGREMRVAGRVGTGAGPRVGMARKGSTHTPPPVGRSSLPPGVSTADRGDQGGVTSRTDVRMYVVTHIDSEVVR